MGFKTNHCDHSHSKFVEKEVCGNLLLEDNFDETAKYKAKVLPDVLYKFVSLYDEDQDEHNKEDNEKKFSSLEKGEIWFSSRKAMNDPFEFKGLYMDKAKMCRNRWSPDAVERINYILQDSFFLSSFTTNMCNNLPMWAYYANNHAGYCIKYRVNKGAIVHQVKYFDQRCQIDGVVTKLFDYGCIQNDITVPEENRKKANIEYQECLEIIHKMYLIKHTSWNHENEFRLFCDALPGERGRNISAASVGLTPTDVFCGVHCSEKHIEKIQSISDKTGLVFHRCKLSPIDFLVIE